MIRAALAVLILLAVAGCLNVVSPLTPTGDGGSDGGADGGQGDAGTDSGVDAGVCSAAPFDLGSALNLYPASPPYFDMLSVDLNGDGMLDLVAGAGNPSEAVDVFFGKSDGSLTAPTRYPGGGVALAIGDMDGDGNPDVVTVSEQRGVIIVDYNSGDGGTLLPTTVAQDPVPDGGRPPILGIATGDLDGDGKADLVWASEGAAGILFNLGDRTFGSPLLLAAQGGVFQGIVVTDLNGDGRPDIAISGSALYLFLTQPDGGLAASVWSKSADAFRLGGGLISMPGGNGPDLAFVSGAQAPGIQLLKNDGTGMFVDGGLLPTSANGTNHLIAGDFNGDCLPDLVAPNFDGDCVPHTSGTASVFYGLMGGGFAPAVIIDTGLSVPISMASFGPVVDPQALAILDTCSLDLDGGAVAVLGDASRH